MSTKIVIDNSSGSFAIDGTVGSAPVPSEAGATLISNSSNQWVSQAVPTSWRNRLINGDMAVSQRNGDAFVTPTSSGVHTVDRWRASQNIEGSNSVYFDGNGDWLSVPNTSTALATNDFTIEAWIYPNSLPTGTNTDTAAAAIISKQMQFILYYGSSGGIEFVYRNSANNSWNVYTAAQTNIAVRTWNHIVVTRSGSTLKIFLNGTTIYSGSWISTTYTNANPITVGRGMDSGYSFYLDGYISNLRLIIGTALYTADFTPSTTPLAAVSGTSLLTCASTTFRDLSANNFTVTAAGNAAVSPAQPFGDAWSNYFDGNGDYLSIADNAALEIGSGDYSVEAWVYLTGYSTDVSYNSTIAQKDTSYALYLTGTSNSFTNVAFAIYDGTSWRGITGNYNFNLNRWYHIAATRTGTTARIFVDGSVLATNSSYNYAAQDNTSSLFIGTNSGFGRYVSGYISNLRIVKGTALYTANFTPNASTPLAAVSGTSLLTCASNKFQDLSANNFTITRAGNVAVSSTTAPIVGNKLTATAGRETGYSAYFDGSGDYLTFNSSASSTISFGAGNFTFETWFNFTSLGNQGNASILTSRSTNNTTNELVICLAGTANTSNATSIRFAYWTSPGAVTQFDFTSSASPAANVWHHLAITRSGSTIRVFLNGSQIGTTTYSGNISTTGAFDIGRLNAGEVGVDYLRYFKGYISNLRIVKGTALYTANFTPSTIPLVPVTSTSLLACASSTFADTSSNNFTVTAAGNAAVSAINPFSQAGFGKSLRWAVSTPASPASTNQALIQQRVEGSNIYDFSWGTAGARAATLSFWVNSPVVGTYCVAVQNPSLDRSYVAEYTVSVANTWERKTVNVPGPTSGFWPTNNSEGLRVSFDMGSGTNYNTTAGAWQTGSFTRTAGALSFSAQALVASSLTNNFYVVGTQLELGSVATPFEVIPYAKQIESCQRYYARMGSLSGNYVGFGAGVSFQGGASAGGAFVYIKYPQRMRASPSINYSNTAIFNTLARAVTAFSSPHIGTDSMSVTLTTAANTQTVGQGVVWTGNISPTFFELDAEL